MARGYWIVSVEVSDPEGYKRYIAENAKAFQKYGARFLARGGKAEVVEGKGRSRIVLIEFKDAATALECYRSPEYSRAIEIRRNKAMADIIVVEGYDGPLPMDGATPQGHNGDRRSADGIAAARLTPETRPETGSDSEPLLCRKAAVVTGGAGYQAEQGSDCLPGISAESVGAKALWLGVATLPPGQRTKAHVHERHETAFYMLSGDEVELWTGDQLQHRDLVHTGDYLLIPPNVLHVAVNRGGKPAVFIGSRNEPTAQESVVMHPEMDGIVP